MQELGKICCCNFISLLFFSSLFALIYWQTMIFTSAAAERKWNIAFNITARESLEIDCNQWFFSYFYFILFLFLFFSKSRNGWTFLASVQCFDLLNWTLIYANYFKLLIWVENRERKKKLNWMRKSFEPIANKQVQLENQQVLTTSKNY